MIETIYNLKRLNLGGAMDHTIIGKLNVRKIFIPRFMIAF